MDINMNVPIYRQQAEIFYRVRNWYTKYTRKSQNVSLYKDYDLFT